MIRQVVVSPISRSRALALSKLTRSPAGKTINLPLDPWFASMAFISRLRVTQDAGARQVGTIILLLVLGLEASAAMLGGDSTWDTRNYHLYNPFALLTGKWRTDIATAQLQSYLPPTLDIPYYLLIRRIGDTRLLNILLEIPHAVAVVLAFLLSLRLLRATDPVSRLTAAVAILIGVTGAATMPFMATAMSDMVGVSLVLGGLLLLVSEVPSQDLPVIRFGAAGLLCGAAVGLKLTFVSAAGGLCLAVLALPASGASAMLLRLLALGCGGVLGGLLTGGWWWALAWQAWGNPLFPFFNNIFHSPLLGLGSLPDVLLARRSATMPESFFVALLFPFLWGSPLTWQAYFHQSVIEFHIRDPRIGIALIAVITILICSIRREFRSSAQIFVAIFFLASFILWEATDPAVRYLSFLELLTGALMAVCAIEFVRTPKGRRAVLFGLVFVLGALRLVTVYPGPERASGHSPPLQANVPRVSDDGLVVLLDGSPLAYLALFEPVSVRFVGANNNLIHPGGSTLLDRDVADAVSGQNHDVWGLESPEASPGEADRVLAFYGLERSSCSWVRTNLVDSGHVRMCQLSRAGHS